MPLSPQDIEQLMASLPQLAFDPDKDTYSLEGAVAAYTRAYSLPSRGPELAHGFGWVDACGYRLATHYWVPEGARGTLVVVHGYYDHVGIFGRAIHFALREGYAVLAFDLPGHGLSSGEQAAIDSFDTYGDVLGQVMARARGFLPQPFHALGQSTGGAVILNYLWRRDEARGQLDKVVLLAPLILPRGWRSGRFLFYLLRPFIRRFPRGGSSSSHDVSFTRFIEQGDPLQARYLSLKWVSAMAAWYRFVLRAPPLDKPMLIIQGTGDQTVAWRYNLRLIARRLPAARVELIPGAGHQLINESPEYLKPLLAIARRWILDRDSPS